MCERREVCHDADGQARGQGVSEIEDLLGKVGAGRLSAARIERERERERDLLERVELAGST